MTKAKTGDLIRIVALGSSVHVDTLKIGGIYEVIAVKDGNISVDVKGGYVVFEDEYEIYRKQAHAAQVGDLIRITTVRDEITAYQIGGIYEVTSLEASNYDQIVINGEHGQSGYVFADEYVVHRKAGEEDDAREPFGYSDATPTQDAVNPQHYKQGRVEVIDIIEDAVRGADPFEAVCQANILKYTLRYRAKNGVEDLRKSVWYANRLIEYLDAKSTQE